MCGVWRVGSVKVVLQMATASALPNFLMPRFWRCRNGLGTIGNVANQQVASRCWMQYATKP